MYRDIAIIPLFVSRTLAAGTTLTSDPVDLGWAAANGYTGMQIYVQGTAVSVAASYLLSDDGKNYVRSSEGSTIVAGTTAFHDKCGTGKNGRDLIHFTPCMAARMKLEFWETTGTGCTLTAHLAVQ